MLSISQTKISTKSTSWTTTKWKHSFAAKEALVAKNRLYKENGHLFMIKHLILNWIMESGFWPTIGITSNLRYPKTPTNKHYQQD